MSTVMLNLEDIQGNIAPGFRSDHQDMLFVRFPNAQAGRTWLEKLAPEVASASEILAYVKLRNVLRRKPTTPPPAFVRRERPSKEIARIVRTTWVNVALTAAGLKAVMKPAKFAAAAFPDDFMQGMAGRVGQTGDRPDEVAAWKVRDSAVTGSPQAAKVAHALLTIGADTEDDLDDENAIQVLRIASLGIHIVDQYRGNTLGGGREHFGFRDGISQPEPSADSLESGWTDVEANAIVKPGEFIVGLPDEAGQSIVRGPSWAKNGSYLTFRRLRQDVAEFRRTVLTQTAVLAARIPNVSEELLAAKLIGRWPSGTRPPRLVNGVVPQQTDPFPMNPDGMFPPGGEPADGDVRINEATYSGDVRGDVCPVFSHVRRAHPRATTGQEPKRHRILRRGIPYGEMLPPGATDTVDRGLLFVAYQADIFRGFERIQGGWFSGANTPEISAEIGVTNGWDPITGFINTPSVSATAGRLVYVHIPGSPTNEKTPIEIGRLVEVTAGGYFFAPPISALTILAAGG